MIRVAIRSKQYPGANSTLRDLRFSVDDGEFVAIVGPSGVGKSTLLNIIGGLDTDYEGSIDLPKPSRLGYLFQEPRLMPWLSVQQNMQLVQPGLGPSELRTMLQEVGLTDCADLYPSQLSGGMQRRVAMLRAFAVLPDLLLLDEPFQSLDAPTATQLRSQLYRLWLHSRATVLMVTHNLSEALALASRVLFLSEGPSRVVLDMQVNLPAPRQLDSPSVQSLAQQLLQDHPELLHGRVQA